MDHKTFVSRTASALQLKSEARPNDAATELRALLRDLEQHVKDGVAEWHQQQALGLLVDVLDRPETERECREAWEALIRFTRESATYWSTALSSAETSFDHWNRRNPPT